MSDEASVTQFDYDLNRNLVKVTQGLGSGLERELTNEDFFWDL